MGALSPTHWLIVLVVLVLLFGAKKLPDMARSIGRSSRILRSEMSELRDDRSAGDAASGGTPAVEAGAPASQPVAERRTETPPAAS